MVKLQLLLEIAGYGLLLCVDYRICIAVFLIHWAGNLERLK